VGKEDISGHSRFKRQEHATIERMQEDTIKKKGVIEKAYDASLRRGTAKSRKLKINTGRRKKRNGGNGCLNKGLKRGRIIECMETERKSSLSE